MSFAIGKDMSYTDDMINVLNKYKSNWLFENNNKCLI